MKFIIVAGDLTDTICSALMQNNKNIDTVGIPTFNEACNRVKMQGFNADKLVFTRKGFETSGNDSTCKLQILKALDVPRGKEIIFIDQESQFEDLIGGVFLGDTKLRYTNGEDFDELCDILLHGSASGNSSSERLDIPGLPPLHDGESEEISDNDCTQDISDSAEVREFEHMMQESRVLSEANQPVDDATITGDAAITENSATISDTAIIADTPIAAPITRKKKDKILRILGGVAKQLKRDITREANVTPIIPDSRISPEKPEITARPVLKSPAMPEATVVNTCETEIYAMIKRSRVITVTGDRRSGVSGLCANMAASAAIKGINTLVIDLDIIHRAQSVYFSLQSNPQDSQHLYSLLNALRTPDMIETFAAKIAENLSVLGIDISTDNLKIGTDAVTSDNLNNLLADARTHYDLTIVDLPYSDIQKYTSVIYTSNVIPFVITPDSMCLLNTVSDIDISKFEETKNFNLLLSKSCLVLNKFAGYLPFDLDGFQEIPTKLKELSDDELFEKLEIVGCIDDFESFGQMLLGTKLTALCDRKSCEKYFRVLKKLYDL